MRLLTALGQDIEIVVKAKPRNRAGPYPCYRRGSEPWQIVFAGSLA